jgi:cephalosporin hydroxylase
LVEATGERSVNDGANARTDARIVVRSSLGEREVDIYSPEGYEVVADLYTRAGWQRRVSYEVTWMGIPVIQLPEDILMLQELLWKVRPDVVIESGVAHGGALIMYASLLRTMGRGRVIGVDVEIRKYNRLAIESHPMSDRITLIEGSSTEPETVAAVRRLVGPSDRILVMLDSNHTRDHVRAELELYASLVSPGSYIVVFDGVMAEVADSPNGRPEWIHDNPLEAVRDFLSTHPEFTVDTTYQRIGVTYCRGGFLRRDDSIT